MAKTDSTFLDVNEPFPDLDLQLFTGEKLNLPQGFGDGYGVILFYRGYWWPFCNQQLADFQTALEEYDAEHIKVIAGSIDPVEKTRELVDKLGLTYPVAYGMDAITISRLTGSFYEEEKKFIQPTGIVIRPDKTVEIAVYSTGAVGRFVAQDVLGVVKYYKSLK
jgi:peroxiredoxin